MIPGALVPARLATLVGEVVGRQPDIQDLGEGVFSLWVDVPGRRDARLMTFVRDGVGIPGPVPGPRTMVLMRADPANVALLRSVLSRTGGFLCPSDGVDAPKWEEVEVTT